MGVKEINKKKMHQMILKKISKKIMKVNQNLVFSNQNQSRN